MSSVLAKTFLFEVETFLLKAVLLDKCASSLTEHPKGVRCIWKDKSGLGYAESIQNIDMKSVTCNCARDKKIYELAGMKLLLNCASSGEYYPLQRTEEGEYYCVDIDGHRKSQNYPQLDVQKCNDDFKQ